MSVSLQEIVEGGWACSLSQMANTLQFESNEHMPGKFSELIKALYNAARLLDDHQDLIEELDMKAYPDENEEESEEDDEGEK